MFCGKCGNTVNEGAAFCNKCGNQINSGAANQNMQMPAQPAHQSAPTQNAYQPAPAQNMYQQTQAPAYQSGKRGKMIGPNGDVKEVKAGLAWFFLIPIANCIIPFVHGETKLGGIYLAIFGVSLLASITGVGIPLAAIISWVGTIFFIASYNKYRIRGLFQKGYKPENEAFTALLRQKGFLV